MIFVVDATVVVRAALVGMWIAPLRSAALAAPTLVWSEVAAAIRQLEFRADVTREQASAGIGWLERSTINAHSSQDLAAEALELARSLGWAKTYDAEYVVLARRLGCALVTADARLRATAVSLIQVKGPAELG